MEKRQKNCCCFSKEEKKKEKKIPLSFSSFGFLFHRCCLVVVWMPCSTIFLLLFCCCCNAATKRKNTNRNNNVFNYISIYTIHTCIYILYAIAITHSKRLFSLKQNSKFPYFLKTVDDNLNPLRVVGCLLFLTTHTPHARSPLSSSCGTLRSSYHPFGPSPILSLCQVGGKRI